MIVLDASAVLAFLHDEPGSATVDDVISSGTIASPNWSEVVQKLHRAGAGAPGLARQLLATGLEVEPLLRDDAEVAARIWQSHTSLSLADRCCLAVAFRLDVPVLTADKAWARVDVGVEIRTLR